MEKGRRARAGVPAPGSWPGIGSCACTPRRAARSGVRTARQRRARAGTPAPPTAARRGARAAKRPLGGGRPRQAERRGSRRHRRGGRPRSEAKVVRAGPGVEGGPERRQAKGLNCAARTGPGPPAGERVGVGGARGGGGGRSAKGSAWENRVGRARRAVLCDGGGTAAGGACGGGGGGGERRWRQRRRRRAAAAAAGGNRRGNRGGEPGRAEPQLRCHPRSLGLTAARGHDDAQI